MSNPSEMSHPEPDSSTFVELSLTDQTFIAVRVISEAACRVLELNPHQIAMLSLCPNGFIATCYRLDDEGRRYFEHWDGQQWVAEPFGFHPAAGDDTRRVAVHTIQYSRSAA